MKIVFKPLNKLPTIKKKNCEYVSMFKTGSAHGFTVGDVAKDLRREVRASGLSPSIQEWDFCTLAIAVAAADEAVPRKKSADGWTRQIEIEVALSHPAIWKPYLESLEETFRFLTGDFWRIRVTTGGLEPPTPPKRLDYDGSCVSLLSGGLDSLVGAIDLCVDGEKPIFLSKIVNGDSDKQTEIAKALKTGKRHLQWSHKSRSTLPGDDQTRGRSIVFLAYAVLASAAITAKAGERKRIIVPENGFISLNVPLSPGRIGSHSTKTTHPVYLDGLERVLNSLKINVEFVRPYQFTTKGEMLIECKDQGLLKKLMGNTTSCGRFGRTKTHCGRCVPCLVRRSAFFARKVQDPTVKSKNTGKNYEFPDLGSALLDKKSSDIKAAATSIMLIERKGIERFIGSSLAFCKSDERDKFKGVIERGLEEINKLLKKHKVR
ncbi:MAG: Qat anti-phage system QueC-like protein QatC [Verrucomicrobiota bacterium]